jgi:hypothetical protein
MRQYIGALQARWLHESFLDSITLDTDSIIDPKRFKVIGLKYENMFFGNFWHSGITVKKDVAGNDVVTFRYSFYDEIPYFEIFALSIVKNYVKCS